MTVMPERVFAAAMLADVILGSPVNGPEWLYLTVFADDENCSKCQFCLHNNRLFALQDDPLDVVFYLLGQHPGALLQTGSVARLSSS